MKEELDKAYDIGYKEGAEEVINRVSKWLDDYTIQSLREQFLGEEWKIFVEKEWYKWNDIN